jgi:hypothetical protein
MDGDAAACGGAEKRKVCDGDAAATCAHAVALAGAPSAAAAGLYGEWRGYKVSCCFRGYKVSCCFAEKLRFRRVQMTQFDSVARHATFDNWRLAAEQGSQMAWSVKGAGKKTAKYHY